MILTKEVLQKLIDDPNLLKQLNEVLIQFQEETIEKALRLLPAVMADVATTQATLTRLKEKFFTENPDFKDRKDVVKAVVQAVETENPGMSYEEILNISAKKIREIINTGAKLDMTSCKRPEKSDLEYHGEI